MEYVNGKEFFHIQRTHQWGPSDSWDPGSTIKIGDQLNPFQNYLETSSLCLPDGKGNNWDLLHLIREYFNYLETGNKDQIMSSFFHYDNVESFRMAKSALEHYMKIARERTFEEIRQLHFKEHPSRYTCLWVIPNDLNILKYWLDRLGEGRILRLSLTGKVHSAREEYLQLKTENPLLLRKNASLYWSGNGATETADIECLFEGNAQVLEVCNPNELGL